MTEVQGPVFTLLPFRPLKLRRPFFSQSLHWLSYYRVSDHYYSKTCLWSRSSNSPTYKNINISDTLPLIHIPLLPVVDLHHRPHTPLHCCIPMRHTLPSSLFLYSWLFLTGGSACSHLLTLVHRSRIFLPWRWRRHVPPKRRFTQDLHSATSQKTTFFIVTAVKASNRTLIFPIFPSILSTYTVAW
jgi:hypothetical protein